MINLKNGSISDCELNYQGYDQDLDKFKNEMEDQLEIN